MLFWNSLIETRSQGLACLKDTDDPNRETLAFRSGLAAVNILLSIDETLVFGRLGHFTAGEKWLTDAPGPTGVSRRWTIETGQPANDFSSACRKATSGDGARRASVSSFDPGETAGLARSYFVGRGRRAYSPSTTTAARTWDLLRPQRHDPHAGRLQTTAGAANFLGNWPHRNFDSFWANRKAFPNEIRESTHFVSRFPTDLQAGPPTTPARSSSWAKQRRHLRRVCRSSSKAAIGDEFRGNSTTSMASGMTRSMAAGPKDTGGPERLTRFNGKLTRSRTGYQRLRKSWTAKLRLSGRPCRNWFNRGIGGRLSALTLGDEYLAQASDNEFASHPRGRELGRRSP